MDIHHNQKAQIQHYVMFWLKDELTDPQVKDFIKFFESLKTIKYLKKISYGLAAQTPKRSVIDNTFTYSLTIIFGSIEDHNAYQEDQIHLDAVEKFAHNWKKVVVHDTTILD